MSMRDVVIVLGAALLGGAGCSKGEQSITVPPQPSAAAVSPPSSVAPDPSPFRQMDGLGFAAALQRSLPMMSDTSNEPSPGTVLLGVWASKRMKWSDVAVTKDETSFALARKDSDEARGKRMCVGGQIVQIQVDKIDGAGKLAEGLLLSDGGNIYSFVAAGSSGELVQQSWARFCGVVTGNYDYSNSVGGEGHAVQLVGMFDLPQNKAKKI